MVRMGQNNRMSKNRQFVERKNKAFKQSSNKTKKDKDGDDDDYWHEIAAKCVDAESLRIQEQMLRHAKKDLERTSVGDSISVHAALETVHILAKRVSMLQCS
jgi:hypothetical protein